MTELKPCPFCGGEVSLAETGDSITRWYIITRGNHKRKINCNCRVFMESDEFVPYSDSFREIAKKMLIKAWNRRAGEEGRHD